MILISAYESELYDNFFKINNHWEMKVIKTTTRGTDGIDKERNEILWMNSSFNDISKKGQITIEYTDKELSQNKQNPRR